MFDYLRELYNTRPNEIQENFRLKLFNALRVISYYTGQYVFAWLDIPDVRNRFIWSQFANENSPLSLTDDILIYTFRSIENITRRVTGVRKQVPGLSQYMLPSTQEVEAEVTITAYDIYALQLTRLHSIWYDINNKTRNDWIGLDFKLVNQNTRVLGNLLIMQTTPDLRYVVSAIQLLGIEPIQDPIVIATTGSIDSVQMREIQIVYSVTHIRKLYVHNQELWQWFVNTFLSETI